MNSPLTPVAGLRAHRRAIVAYFVVRREISHKAIWDFFNSIGQTEKHSARADVFRSSPKNGREFSTPQNTMRIERCGMLCA